MTPIERLLNRMYNWKMTSAVSAARAVPELTSKSRKILNDLSDRFGDCGWQDGSAYDAVRDGNNRVAEELGYKWDDDKDYWVKERT
jgi:hypothetical protein